MLPHRCASAPSSVERAATPKSHLRDFHPFGFGRTDNHTMLGAPRSTPATRDSDPFGLRPTDNRCIRCQLERVLSPAELTGLYFSKSQTCFPPKIFANGMGDEGPAAWFAKVIRKVTLPECPPDLGTARPTNRGYRGAVVYSTAGAGVQAFNLTPAASPTPERETRVGRKGKANSQKHSPSPSFTRDSARVCRMKPRPSGDENVYGILFFFFVLQIVLDLAPRPLFPPCPSFFFFLKAV